MTAWVLRDDDVTEWAREASDPFWDSRATLRHIYDFARARSVAPWATLGVTLARVVVATPYVVGLPPIIGSRASLNLFVGLVGKSGSGKDAAADVAAEAVQVGYIETHTVGSGEGIGHGYMHNTKGGPEWNDEQHAVLFEVSEIDTLTALANRRGSTLLPELRKAWTGKQLGFGYADPAKRLKVPAHQYRLGLVAGIQPLRAEHLLTDADGGTPQRFIWLPATDPDIPDQPPPCPEPLHWRFPTPPGGLTHPDSTTTWSMPVCEAAREVIVSAHRARNRGDADALDGHALLCRLKIAAALALLEGHLEVGDEDWDLAGAVLRQSDRTRATVQRAIARHHEDTGRARAEADADRAVVVSERVTEASVQRVCRSMTRHLQKLPASEWIGHSDLRKKLASRDRSDFEDSIERLADAGLIEIDDHPGQGRSGTRYRLQEQR